MALFLSWMTPTMRSSMQNEEGKGRERGGSLRERGEVTAVGMNMRGGSC